MIATSGFLTALECTRFDFGLKAYIAPPDTLAGLRGPTSKGRGGKRKGGESRGMEGKR